MTLAVKAIEVRMSLLHTGAQTPEGADRTRLDSMQRSRTRWLDARLDRPGGEPTPRRLPG